MTMNNKRIQPHLMIASLLAMFAPLSGMAVEPLCLYVEQILNQESAFQAQLVELADDPDLLHAEKASYLPLFGDNDDSPPGGYIFRFRVSLFGGRQLDTFLGSSLGPIGRSDDHLDWRVVLSPSNTFVESSLKISPEFWLKSGSQGQALLSNYSAYKGVQEITTYAIETSGAVTSTDQEVTPSAGDLGQQYNLGVKQEITIEKILLHELMANPGAAWRPVKTDISLREQYKDPADEGAIAAAAGFTFQQASALLQQWKNQQ